MDIYSITGYVLGGVLFFLLCWGAMRLSSLLGGILFLMLQGLAGFLRDIVARTDD